MFTLGDVADVLDGALDTGISIIDTLAKLSDIADEGSIDRKKCFSRLQISPDINNNHNDSDDSFNGRKQSLRSLTVKANELKEGINRTGNGTVGGDTLIAKATGSISSEVDVNTTLSQNVNSQTTRRNQQISEEDSATQRKHVNRRTTFVLEQSPVKTIEEATAQGIPIIEALGDLCSVADNFLKDYSKGASTGDPLAALYDTTKSPTSPEDFDLLISSKVNEILSSFQKLDFTVDQLKKKALKDNFSHFKNKKEIETLLPRDYRGLLNNSSPEELADIAETEVADIPIKHRPGTYILSENESDALTLKIDFSTKPEYQDCQKSLSTKMNPVGLSPRSCFFEPQSTDSMKILNRKALSTSKRLPELQVFPIDVDVEPLPDDSKNKVDTGFNLSRSERPGTYVLLSKGSTTSSSSSNGSSPIKSPKDLFWRTSEKVNFDRNTRDGTYVKDRSSSLNTEHLKDRNFERNTSQSGTYVKDRSSSLNTEHLKDRNFERNTSQSGTYVKDRSSSLNTEHLKDRNFERNTSQSGTYVKDRSGSLNTSLNTEHLKDRNFERNTSQSGTYVKDRSDSLNTEHLKDRNFERNTNKSGTYVKDRSSSLNTERLKDRNFERNTNQSGTYVKEKSKISSLETSSSNKGLRGTHFERNTSKSGTYVKENPTFLPDDISERNSTPAHKSFPSDSDNTESSCIYKKTRPRTYVLFGESSSNSSSPLSSPKRLPLKETICSTPFQSPCHESPCHESPQHQQQLASSPFHVSLSAKRRSLKEKNSKNLSIEQLEEMSPARNNKSSSFSSTTSSPRRRSDSSPTKSFCRSSSTGEEYDSSKDTSSPHLFMLKSQSLSNISQVVSTSSYSDHVSPDNSRLAASQPNLIEHGANKDTTKDTTRSGLGSNTFNKLGMLRKAMSASLSKLTQFHAVQREISLSIGALTDIDSSGSADTALTSQQRTPRGEDTALSRSDLYSTFTENLFLRQDEDYTTFSHQDTLRSVETMEFNSDTDGDETKNEFEAEEKSIELEDVESVPQNEAESNSGVILREKRGRSSGNSTNTYVLQNTSSKRGTFVISMDGPSPYDHRQSNSEQLQETLIYTDDEIPGDLHSTTPFVISDSSSPSYHQVNSNELQESLIYTDDDTPKYADSDIDEYFEEDSLIPSKTSPLRRQTTVDKNCKPRLSSRNSNEGFSSVSKKESSSPSLVRTPKHAGKSSSTPIHKNFLRRKPNLVSSPKSQSKRGNLNRVLYTWLHLFFVGPVLNEKFVDN